MPKTKKFKVVVNPVGGMCTGCYFTRGSKCSKPYEMELSCIVKSNYGAHMGIIVEDKDEPDS